MKKELVSNVEKFNNFVIYKTDDGLVNIDVYFFDDTIWLNQKLIAELFGTTKQNVSLHLNNIFNDLELDEKSVVKKFLTTATDGKNYKTNFYNLKAIIAVGFRTNSERAIKFRTWSAKALEEFIVKGFLLDDERLKQSKYFGKDYYDNLLERIREIRISERRFYQKITDLFALSADYDKSSQITKDFFASVQNKLHWAITGLTAAEIIYTEADAEKIYMGLKTWKNSPRGKILKRDVIIAKNYLAEQHLKELERVVSAYLDLAENRATRQIVTNMNDWSELLVQVLKISSYPILMDNGKITALEAKIKASEEYDKFRVTQDREYVSDFDREIKKVLEAQKKKGK
ncbi:MAG: hypothetical protein US25_C0015G0009 [Candidatus Moranbacteria bacterium GW2011_GWE1_36_7]|nr:MAG: hypothetical protein UR99_C0010G0013 [Candidatus Moranbacteria bacterium GW2011_GWD2_36_12]KKQ06694.1 MAG: hypothetical protein US16_C0011G0013 [Candidatus Moranbacteria bacterium GW2011_GWE2_36_40]KKQ14976.1 MAG: hypothetical protein US25_C0015G0009 [Candidatus Moranbacteria bacterium GW2011_GWE1_36_7]